jgi:hypothetical protein
VRHLPNRRLLSTIALPVAILPTPGNSAHLLKDGAALSKVDSD